MTTYAELVEKAKRDDGRALVLDEVRRGSVSTEMALSVLDRVDRGRSVRALAIASMYIATILAVALVILRAAGI